MNLEPKARAFLEAFKAANLPPMHLGGPEAARATMAALRKTTPPLTIRRVEDALVPAVSHDLPVRLYSDVENPEACLLYLHGGGWVLGGIEDSDPFARAVASSTACAVVSVGYRLAPEAPFPAALEDARAALDWLSSRRGAWFGRDIPIGVIGDSAGANLAAVVANTAIAGALAFQVLAYPVTDAAMAGASYQAFSDGMLMTRELMGWFWRHYLADEAHRRDPRASPLRASSLATAPAAFVLTAENDILRDEGEAYAKALRRAGVPTLCRRYDGQIHGFLTLVGVFDGGAAALGDIAEFIAQRLADRAWVPAEPRGVD